MFYKSPSVRVFPFPVLLLQYCTFSAPHGPPVWFCFRLCIDLIYSYVIFFIRVVIYGSCLFMHFSLVRFLGILSRIRYLTPAFRLQPSRESKKKLPSVGLTAVLSITRIKTLMYSCTVNNSAPLGPSNVVLHPKTPPQFRRTPKQLVLFLFRLFLFC